MTNRITHSLNNRKKLLLAGAGTFAITVPVVLGISYAPQSQAQIATAPKFEVASIKPHDPARACCTLANAGGGRLTVVGLTVKMLIGTAYRVRDFQVFGGPAWMNSDRFDIEAKAEAVTDMSAERSPLLLQSLLRDRFELRLHTETRQLPIYELVRAKSGPKLHAVPAPTKPEAGAPDPPPQPGDALHPGAFRWSVGDISGSAVAMDKFVGVLAMLVGRPVIDKTGLTGFFDIKLQWTLDRGPQPSPNDDTSGPSLFTAIQEQLGLRFESAKGPVEAIVVDSLEKPSDN